MSRSYVPWNIGGIAVAIVGFVIGSLKGPMGAGGAHSTIGAAIGLTGVAITLLAYVLERRRRRAART